MTVFLNFINLKTPQTNQGNIIFYSHKVLAYTGPEVIKYLKKYTNGARIEDFKEAPKIINCELYSVFKAKYLIFYHIGNKEPATKPFKQIIFNLILIKEIYNGNKWISHLYYILIKMNLLDTHKSKREYNNILKRFINIIRTRFGYIIKFIRIDNEQSFKGRYRDFLAIIGITLKWTAPYSP